MNDRQVTEADVDLAALAGEFEYPTVKITVVPERGFGGTRTLRPAECKAIVNGLLARPPVAAADGEGEASERLARANARLVAERDEARVQNKAYAEQQVQWTRVCAAHVAANDHLTAQLASRPPQAGELALIEAIRRTRTRLEHFCNEANAGRMPSDAREFMRRVQCGFDSLFEDAAMLAAAPLPSAAPAVGEWQKALEQAEAALVIAHSCMGDSPKSSRIVQEAINVARQALAPPQARATDGNREQRLPEEK